jgi:uncharacterized protein
MHPGSILRIAVHAPIAPVRATSMPWTGRLTWSQQWQRVLFLHWPVPCESLVARLPEGVELDFYEGQAWVSLVIFNLRIRPRLLPHLPGFSSLTEINLRTYVRFQEKPGIYFLSMHADNSISMRLARLLTPFRYERAAIAYQRADARLAFEAEALPPLGQSLRVLARPHGRTAPADEGSLDSWLTERYRVFAEEPRWGLVAAEVSHPPWTLQAVEALEFIARRRRWGGLDLPTFPELAHYSEGVRAAFRAFQACRA